MSNCSPELRFLRWTFIVLACLSFLAFLPILVTIFLAATVASVVFPFKERLRRRFGGPDSRCAEITASTVTIIMVVFVFVAVAAALTLLFLLQADTLRQFAISVSEKVSRWLGDLLPSRPNISDYAMKLISSAASYLYPLVTKMGVAVLHLIIFLVALFAFLLHGRRILNALLSLLPHHKEFLSRMLTRAHDTLYAVYFVHFVTAIATFLLALPFFAALSFKPLLFWAVLCALFQLIPFLGPTLIMVALSIWCFATNKSVSGVLMLAVGYPVVCAFPDIVLRPILMGRHAKVNTLILWIGFLGGLLAMGPVGFVAGPLLLSLLVFVLSEQAHNSTTRPK